MSRGSRTRRTAAGIALFFLIAASGPAAAVSVGIAYCTATGKVGFADGLPDENEAASAAVQDCVQGGGIPDCCANHVLTTSAGCIAVARGNEALAFGQGSSPAEAVGNAIINCQLDTQSCIAMGHLCD